MSASEKLENKPVRSRVELSRLLDLRREIKGRTPNFQRQESWRFARIHEPWRKPKGIDSHMRLSVKGWPPLVKIGYRGPKEARGLHPSGYREVLVRDLSDLESISPNQQAARLSAGLGRRKRVEFAKRAKELGIRVLNGRGLLVGKSSETKEDDKEKKSEEKSEAPKKEPKRRKTKRKSSKQNKDKDKRSK